MPYKHQGAYHDAIREYLKHLRPPNAQSERGVVRQKTIDEYRGILFEAGRLLGWPNPRGVTLEEMRSLEPCISGTLERTMAKKLSVIRAFLRYHGNADAMRWRIAKHPAPYRGGVFLNERQVTRLHMEARKLGPLAELVVSLAVDNGLRTVDINRLTMENARDFLDTGESDICGKGRNGGKIALQIFSSYTRPILVRYLEERQEYLRRAGAGSSRLVLKLVTYHQKRPYLASLSKDDYSRIAKELSARIGVSFRFHDLRRTLGHRLHVRGVPIETIAKILRHEDCGQAFRAYIGIDSNEMRTALDSLCPGEPIQSAM